MDSLEREREANQTMDDMTHGDYKEQIKELKETIKNLYGIIDTLKLTADSLRASNDKNVEQNRSLQELVEDLKRELKKYQDYNGRHNKMSMGKKSMKRRNSNEDTRSREQEEQECDNGHDATQCEDKDSKESGKEEGKLDKTKVKSEYIDEERGTRGPYTTMDAAKVVTLETSLVGAPEDMNFTGYKNVEEYSKISYIRCTRFKVAIYEDKYGVRHEYYMPQDPKDERRPHINAIPGTNTTPELLSDLAVDRYLVMTPNHRETVRMIIDKFTSSENTRLNWLQKGAFMLKPLMELIKKKLLKVGSVVNIDETWTRVRIKFKGDGTKLGKYFKKYIWVLINKIENVAYFLYDNEENDSRGKRPINKFLAQFMGTIQSDGYIVYKQLTKDNPLLKHILCWAHVRARFVYAADISKQEEANLFIDLIGYLYAIEAENIVLHRTPDEIKKRRAQKDICDTLKSIKKKALGMLADKHAHYSEMMLNALNYMVNGWDGLDRYRTDGRYTIDNMYAERAIRPFTVSRKNSLHFSSEDGVQIAMIYHTVIETAKMCGLEIKEYLTHVFREIISGNKDYKSLLPEAVAAK